MLDINNIFNMAIEIISTILIIPAALIISAGIVAVVCINKAASKQEKGYDFNLEISWFGIKVDLCTKGANDEEKGIGEDNKECLEM